MFGCEGHVQEVSNIRRQLQIWIVNRERIMEITIMEVLSPIKLNAFVIAHAMLF